MATVPVVKRKGVTLQSADPCPRTSCGNAGHLLSDHDEAKVRQCSKCACVAQDTN